MPSAVQPGTVPAAGVPNAVLSEMPSVTLPSLVLVWCCLALHLVQCLVQCLLWCLIFCLIRYPVQCPVA